MLRRDGTDRRTDRRREGAELADTERDELLSARKGDPEAGRRLMARHGPSMIRTAWRVLGRYWEAEAEDVVQEAFIAALTTPAIPAGEDVGAWLRAIVVRKALDQIRRTTRRAEQPLLDSDAEGSELAAAGNPEATLEVLAVRAALARLSSLDRAVLTLVDLEGRSMAEAARALGSTRVGVRLRASRARKKLARLLAPVVARVSEGESS